MSSSFPDSISVSAPGRIVLCGEHQDYFGLPVIPAAVNLRISIIGNRRLDNIFHIDMPDIGGADEFDVGGSNAEADVPYILERDYLRGAVNVLRRNGVKIEHGYDCVVRGNIPINSGTSSSSALCVAWVKFLLHIAGDKRRDDPMQIARLAYLSEVEEFGEPGGMMDHCASAVGGVIFAEFKPEFLITSLPVKLGAFVLGDSLELKDTVKTLTRIKTGTLSAIQKLEHHIAEHNASGNEYADPSDYFSILTEDERLLFEGMMTTRNVTHITMHMFSYTNIEDSRLGQLLNMQQEILRDKLRISTPKLEKMIDASRKAGALGAKINGSGEGGAMFAYAPENAEQVARAIEDAGGKAYIIKVDEGVRIDTDKPRP